MRPAVPLAVLLASLLLSAPALAQSHVKAEFVSEHAAITPGSFHTFAVRLDIQSGWHVYWLSSGDTGLPISLELKAPSPQLSLGPLGWPAPQRYVHETGELVDFVYEGTVFVLIPVFVSPGAKPGSTVSLKADVSWLVCDKDACIPGSADLSLKVKVAAKEGAPTVHAELMNKARSTLPSPRPKTLSARWDGLTLVVKGPAKSLVAFPLLPEDHPPAKMVETCVTTSGVLRIPYPERARAAKRFRVLVGVGEGDGASHHWLEPGPP